MLYSSGQTDSCMKTREGINEIRCTRFDIKQESIEFN